MIEAIRRWVDPLIVLLLLTMLLGIFLPASGGFADVLSVVSGIAIAVLFLVHGMTIPTSEAIRGMKNFRLQGAVLVFTFVFFPIIGLIARPLTDAILGDNLAAGLLFLCLLPSTVQSSIAFTSIARGNVAGAVCAAAVSNILGMVITPILVALFLHRTSEMSLWSSLLSVFVQMLLPFIVGQFLQPLLGQRVRDARWPSMLVDRGTIILVVYTTFSAGMVQNIWSGVGVGTILILIVICCVLLAIVLCATWWSGAALSLSREDRIVLLMCGSKKSLATGVPMANVLFPTPPGFAATMVLPLMVFHQIQLFVCAILARRLGHGYRVQEILSES